MRMSRLFGETLRSVPADAELAGHRLLLRAGYIRPLAPGSFSFLPLGLRSLRKIESILREELEKIGGQEVAMPVVQPAELARRSGRWEGSGEQMVRFEDRAGRQSVIAVTREESAAFLAGCEITSYRRLPALLFQIGPSFRDELRPRGGLIRARELTLMGSYSFDRDVGGLEEQYRNHLEALARVIERLGLDDVVLAESGIGDGLEHEFFFLSEAGDERVALCGSCGYAANLSRARFARPEPPEEAPQALEKVATPGTDTIESLAALLEVPASRTAKAVFYSATLFESGDPQARREVVVMALVRGDMEVSEAKLLAATGATRLRPATADAIADVGACAGYASPIGLDSEKLLVVVDELVATTPNLVSGANEDGFHFRNVNFGRDYKAGMVADIAAAFAGAACPQCTARLELAAGVRIGGLRRFGPGYAERLDATYQDEDGAIKPMHIGSYDMGVDRLLACIADYDHDERGLCLPASVAPYQVYLVAVTGGDATIEAHADALYESMRAAGLQVLYDDRDVRGGVKFNDADLIGVPVRVTIGARSLEQGGVELKRRDRDEREIVAVDAVGGRVRKALA